MTLGITGVRTQSWYKMMRQLINLACIYFCMYGVRFGSRDTLQSKRVTPVIVNSQRACVASEYYHGVTCSVTVWRLVYAVDRLMHNNVIAHWAPYTYKQNQYQDYGL